MVAQQLGHLDTAFSEPLAAGQWSVWVTCQCGWESHAYTSDKATVDGHDLPDREWAQHVIDELVLREPVGKRRPEPWPFSVNGR